jgi:hypothetical protein
MQPEVEQVRALLNAHYAWSPHDFIRDPAFVAADRALFVEMLTRAIAEENDLRMIVEDAGERFGIFAERLPWDTDFFGYPVIKLHAIVPLTAPMHHVQRNYTPALRVFLDMLRREHKAQGFQYVFAPVDPRDLPSLRALPETGFSLIETRCIYHRSLKALEQTERYPTRAATPDDLPGLCDAAEKMVNPFDRFHADPFISPQHADKLMRRWVEASVLEGFADVTIVPDAPNPTAFCTVRYHRDKWERWGLKLAQPVFSAVSPEFKGWYRKIISEISHHLVGVGAEHSFLITQITNGAVIHSWETLGYALGKGEHIFRMILQ